jgi:two-component system response regulator
MEDMTSRPAKVLLVEDDELDFFLTVHDFRSAKLFLELHRVHDGAECMAYLRREVPYGEAPRPDLILLDTNLPKMDGSDVMAALCREEMLVEIPIILLTASSAEADRLRATGLRCTAHIVKPLDFQKLAEVLRQLQEYWFTIVLRPQLRKRDVL